MGRDLREHVGPILKVRMVRKRGWPKPPSKFLAELKEEHSPNSLIAHESSRTSTESLVLY